MTELDSPNNKGTTIVAGRDGVTNSHITRFTCQNMGHYSVQCQKVNGAGLAQVGFVLTQSNAKNNSIENLVSN